MTIEPLPVLASVLIGLVVGTGFFAALWVTVQRLPDARHPVLLWALSALLRVAAVAGVLLLMMKWGVPQLVGAFVGFIGARFVSVRIWGRVREPGMPAPSDREGGG